MLLRSVHITDLASTHHGLVRDVRITEGKISEIAETLTANQNEEIFAEPDARLSPGFVDIGAYLGDPGHEEREDIASLVRAAAAGGYVAVAALPNTVPVRQSVADVSYLLSHNGKTAVDLLPLAALSRDTKGKDLTEMLELNTAGAVGFTDGPTKATSGSLLKRSLEYAKTFSGTVLATPIAPAYAPDGQIHEGEMSVRLGMRGIPTMCETIPLQRDLELTSYAGGKLIVHLLSSERGLEIYRRGGAAGAKLMSTASAHHLCFTVEELGGFDPNFKMMPPLREEADRRALLAGVLDGTIDAVVSNHRARHGEEKDLEFSYASFGARGLETALRQLLSVIEGEEQLGRIIAALTAGPRRLLGLPPLGVEVGSPASLTLFSTAGASKVGPGDLKGKTLNSPLLGRELPGRILATINNHRLWTSAS